MGLLINLSLFATGSSVTNAPQPVANVELNRYFGSWYELVSIPNSFQDNLENGYGRCYNTIAEYAPLKREKLSVKNICYRYNEQGEGSVDVAEAIGRSVKGSGNAKLKVNFTGIALLRWAHIGDGDYWIFGLGPVNESGLYSWAFVGSPDRKFGWILSRTKTLSSGERAKINNLILEKGYLRENFINSRKP